MLDVDPEPTRPERGSEEWLDALTMTLYLATGEWWPAPVSLDNTCTRCGGYGSAWRRGDDLLCIACEAAVRRAVSGM